MAAHVEISKKLVLINSASSVVHKALDVTVMLWMHQHLIRRIPVEEYALLPVLLAIVAATPLLTTVLLGGLGRYVTEAYARGDERRVTQIVSTITPLLAGVALLLGGLGAVFLWKIDFVLVIEPAQLGTARLMGALLIGNLVIQLLSAPFALGFYVRQKFVVRHLIGTGGQLLRIAILFGLLLGVSTRVLWVVVAMVLAGLTEMVVVVTMSRRLLPALRFRASEWCREVLRPVVTYGSWTVLGQVSTIIREVVDPILLNRFAGATHVAAFHLGAQPDRHLRRTVFSAVSTAQPAATAMVATGQADRLQSTWFRLSRYSLWVMLGTTVPLIVFRDEFFRVYLQEKYEALPQASLVLALLLGRYVAIFPNAGTGLVAHARAKQRAAQLPAFSLEIANLTLTLLLVAVLNMGAVGSALATFAVSIVGHPLLLWTLGLRLIHARFGDWFRASILRGIAPGLAAFPVWWALHVSRPPDTWIGLILCGGAGWIVYLVALWFVLPAEDRKLVRAALDRLRRH